MNLSGHYFTYDGKSSTPFGLKFMHLDTERFKKLSADIEYQTSYKKGAREHVINGTKFTDTPLEFEVEFISENPIEEMSARKIKRWLFNKPDFAKLYADMHHDDTYERINGVMKRTYIKCVFYSPEEIRFAAGLFGWKAKCLISSPMAIQDEIEMKFSDFTNDIVVPVDTDLSGYVYPLITIHMKTGSSDVSIINKADQSRQFKIVDLNSASKIFIDNEVGTIVDSDGTSWYGNLYNRQFFRLMPGNNPLTINGNIASLTIAWSNSRWIV